MRGVKIQNPLFHTLSNQLGNVLYKHIFLQTEISSTNQSYVIGTIAL
jgi:hypothetical protein